MTGPDAGRCTHIVHTADKVPAHELTRFHRDQPDAVLRFLQAAEIIGACALLCQAIDQEASAFHAKHGFVESPIQALMMMLVPPRRGAR